MEASLKGKGQYGLMITDLNTVGKKSLEWDLNEWRWDGDLFTASPLNSVPSDCRSRHLFPVGPDVRANADFPKCSSSVFEDVNLQSESGKREIEKRRRVMMVEDEELEDNVGGLNLNIGGQAYPITGDDIKSGKKIKSLGTVPNGPVCQVEGCTADLSNAKDYHRRHKVCETHSKAGEALVRNSMQRFCQQCSRFHLLQEFDEGKRSCRRRLAGHNKRRRKAQPETVVSGGSLNDEKSSHYLLVSLLRILSNMHSSSLHDMKDEDLLSHLLRNLASTVNVENLSSLLQESKNIRASAGSLHKTEDATPSDHEPAKAFGHGSVMDNAVNLQDSARPVSQYVLEAGTDSRGRGTGTANASVENQQSLPIFNSASHCRAGDSRIVEGNESENTARRINSRNIDLNNAYDDTLGCIEIIENSRMCHAPQDSGNGFLRILKEQQQDTQKSSPPQTSSISNSTSSRSPSSSSGEGQSRTGRIVFKLFGKDPNDLPLALRTQIVDWLSHSPTDMESYIRPGCIVLTIYICLGKTLWEELCFNLGFSLRRLLDAPNDTFWRTGWIYTRVQDIVAFVNDGKIILTTPLPMEHHKDCRILSIKPIAVSVSERAQFSVRGFNLFRPTCKLFCALEGKYLAEKSFSDLLEGAETVNESDELQCLTFSCSIPKTSGRGFVEVEDHGLSSSFFPFIVAEEEVCSEICTLESEIEAAETTLESIEEFEHAEARSKALDFIHEIGWLFHRSQAKLRLRDVDHTLGLFSLKRFKWLMEFAIEHDWCAVVKKLLGIFFDGVVDAGEYPLVDLALLDMALLHRAVRRNCKAMVEFLLRYVPDEGLDNVGSEWRQRSPEDRKSYFFKANAIGPAGLTPLHIAASIEGSEFVLDALTNDPLEVGLEAWKSARDDSGLTPFDYACLRGHYSYVQLVQRKAIGKSKKQHVIIDVPLHPKHKALEGPTSAKPFSLEHGTPQLHCKLCEQKIPYRIAGTSLVARPAMLSLVAIAAVCVCAALLFKSLPEVRYIFQPFSWETLKYGSS